MYSNFEQDLILACKGHYGSNGIEKVIADYVGYREPEKVLIGSKYHFISELYLKMISNNHIKLTNFLDGLSPDHIYDPRKRVTLDSKQYSLYDVSVIVCGHMIGGIQNSTVWKNDERIIELHEPDEKFKEEAK